MSSNDFTPYLSSRGELWRRGRRFGGGVEQRGKRLCVRESVVYARRYAAGSEVRAAAEQAVFGARFEEFEVSQGGRIQARIPAGERGESRLAAVGSPAAPVRPLEIPRAPAVVPRAVGQHEFYVGFHRLLGGFEDFGVFRRERVSCERRKSFLDIVAEVHALAPIGARLSRWLGLAEYQAVFRRDVFYRAPAELPCLRH